MPLLFTLLAQVAYGLEISGLTQNETTRFIKHWTEIYPNQELYQIEAEHVQWSRYINVLSDVKWNGNGYHSGKSYRVKLSGSEYIDQLSNPSAITGTGNVHFTKTFGKYIGKCGLHGEISSGDMMELQKFFNKQETVKVYRSSITIANLRHFASHIHKHGKDDFTCRLGGIFSGAAIRIDSSSHEITYKIHDDLGPYSDAAKLEPANLDLEVIEDILSNGNTCEVEAILNYVSNRFNPNLEANLFNKSQRDRTSLEELEQLLPLITHHLTVNISVSHGDYFTGPIACLADRALSSAQAWKQQEPFSNKDFRKSWKHEDIEKRAIYWK